MFKNVNFMVNKGDKIAVLSQNSLATTAFYNVLTGTGERIIQANLNLV